MTKHDMTKYAYTNDTESGVELFIGADVPGEASHGAAVSKGFFSSVEQAREHAVQHGCARFNDAEPKPAHTWHIAFFNATPKNESPYHKIDSDDAGIAHVYGGEEIARLIASAPDLLAACKALLKAADVIPRMAEELRSSEWQDYLNADTQARAAISRAEQPA